MDRQLAPEITQAKMPVIKAPGKSEFGLSDSELRGSNTLQAQVKAAETLSREGRHQEAAEMYTTAALSLEAANPSQAVELHTQAANELALAQGKKEVPFAQTPPTNLPQQ